MRRLQFTILSIASIIFLATDMAHTNPDIYASNSLKISVSQRFRIETWDNTTSLASAAAAGNSYLRVRSRLSFIWQPKRHIEFGLRLGNEFRKYFVPENRKFTLDELFFDQFYLAYNEIAGSGFSAKIGRQDMFFGDGLLVADGGPLDGSRSAYFNAVRIDWHKRDFGSLTLFYCDQPEKDIFLPVINSQDRKLIEYREQGWGIYWASSMNRLAIESYLIAKYSDARGDHMTAKDAHTLGSRIICNIGQKAVITNELAGQFGGKWNLGYTGQIDYLFTKRNVGPHKVSAGLVYLSGDDEGYGIRGWNPMFGRWPKWSESYIYTLAKETGVAYWTNLFAVYTFAIIGLAENLELQIRYYRLMAPARPRLSGFPSGDGHLRGDLAIGQFKYKLNDKVSGHFLYEYFNPGNYYFRGADNYGWARMELLINY